MMKAYSFLIIFFIFVNSVSAQNIGIGTQTPEAKLHVNGTIKITDGTQGQGKVLTSDNTGLASWQNSISSVSLNGIVGYGTWGDCSVNNISEYNPVAERASIGFGRSVSLDSNYAIIGAPSDTVGGFAEAGAAYLYNFNGINWILQKRIPNPDPNTFDYFGACVSISGDNIIINAYSDDGAALDAGAAYIYNIKTNLLTKITSPDATASDLFGIGVSISGTKAIIGAHLAEGTSTNVGVAYIYDINTGIFTKILNPDVVTYDYFGYSVSISGNYAIIGAYGNDAGASDAGAAFIYNISNNSILKIPNPDAAVNDYFGYSVSISGNYAVIGAFRDDIGATDAGAAYIYSVNNNVISKIRNPDPGVLDLFGNNVNISGSYTIIGANYDDGGATDGGASYIYQNINGYFDRLQKFTKPRSNSNDLFGTGVAVDGITKRFLVGAFNLPVATFGKIN